MAKARDEVVPKPTTVFGRRLKYAVLPIDAVRALNIRTDEEVVEAQKRVDEDVLNSLEEMVNAARAGRLASKEALALQAAWW